MILTLSVKDPQGIFLIQFNICGSSLRQGNIFRSVRQSLCLGGHAWQGHAWQRGMRGLGGMLGEDGGMHGRGVCGKRQAWQGACVGGHVWQGVACMAGEAYVVGGCV